MYFVIKRHEAEALWSPICIWRYAENGLKNLLLCLPAFGGAANSLFF